jgi:hypothetical protein
VCKSSYVHPRLLEDFTADRLTPRLGRAVRKKLHGRTRITLDAMRAIEPLVARYVRVQPQ